MQKRDYTEYRALMCRLGFPRYGGAFRASDIHISNVNRNLLGLTTHEARNLVRKLRARFELKREAARKSPRDLRRFIPLLHRRFGMERLHAIIDTFPRTRHTHGHFATLTVTSKRLEVARVDKTDHLKWFRGYPVRHGEVTLNLTLKQLLTHTIVGGLLTFPETTPKANRPYKASYVRWEPRGYKINPHVEPCWVCGTVHAKTRTEAWETWNRIQADAKAQAERDAEYARYHELALRMRYCVTNSTAAGNCMGGTLSFLSRLGVDPAARPKTGRSILRAARHMGLQRFVERMINRKTYELQQSQREGVLSGA